MGPFKFSKMHGCHITCKKKTGGLNLYHYHGGFFPRILRASLSDNAHSNQLASNTNTYPPQNTQIP